MSIRPDSATRFSLRSAIIGKEPYALPATLPLASTPFTIKPEAQPVSGPGFTFNSIMPSSAIQTPPLPNVTRNNANAEMALKKIAEYQKNNQSSHGTSTNVTAAQSARNNQFLNVGYVAGGSSKMEAASEILRLTANTQALSTKLEYQAERLAKTEASLIKANRAITGERAVYNTRIVQMQADLKSLKDEEIKMKNTISTYENMHVSNKYCFSDSVKKATELDAKILDYETQVQKLTYELSDARQASTDAVSKLVDITEKHEALVAAQSLNVEAIQPHSAACVEEMEAEISCLKASNEVSLAECATAKHAFDTASLSNTTLTTDNVQLRDQLVKIEKARDAAVTQVDVLLGALTKQKETIAAYESTTTPTSCGTYGLGEEGVAELGSAELERIRKLDEDQLTLMDNLSETDKEIASVTLKGMATDISNLQTLLVKRIAISTFLDEKTLKSYNTTNTNNRFDDDAFKACYFDPLAETTDYYLNIDTGAPTGTHPKINTNNLHKLVTSRKDARVSNAIPPWAGLHITTTQFAQPSTSDSKENKIQKLVEIVSSDITAACLHQRRMYLSEFGMTSIQIDSDIDGLLGNANGSDSADGDSV